MRTQDNATWQSLFLRFHTKTMIAGRLGADKETAINVRTVVPLRATLTRFERQELSAEQCRTHPAQQHRVSAIGMSIKTRPRTTQRRYPW